MIFQEDGYSLVSSVNETKTDIVHSNKHPFKTCLQGSFLMSKKRNAAAVTHLSTNGNEKTFCSFQLKLRFTQQQAQDLQKTTVTISDVT